jgi:amidase
LGERHIPAPLHYQPLTSLVAQMRDGTLSAREVTEHHLERIAALDPTLHAYAEVRADRAREDAAAADVRRAKGETLGPLHGAPVSVKDLCAMKGTRTGAGGFFSTGFGPDDTATVVRRLQEAGAIVLGKAQLTEGAWGTHHPDIPVPVNPWAPNRWSGSSSSGSGVSVASGMAAGTIGTDTAGSIRYPSAANGIVGLKPTWGRVSRHGVFPLSDTFDHVGPMARTVADVALMFSCIAGPDSNDPTTLDVSAADCADAASNASLKGVRIGVDRRYTFSSIEPTTAEALRKGIGTVQAAWREPGRCQHPASRRNPCPAILAAFSEAAISHRKTYPAERERYSDEYANLLEIGLNASGVEYATAAIWRREFAGSLALMFSTLMSWPCPSCRFRR